MSKDFFTYMKQSYNYKTDPTPEQLDEILNLKMEVRKKYIQDGNVILELYQYGDGEFGLDSKTLVQFEPTMEHLQVLARHNIYIK